MREIKATLNATLSACISRSTPNFTTGVLFDAFVEFNPYVETFQIPLLRLLTIDRDA